jgi:hypothetical protein
MRLLHETRHLLTPPAPAPDVCLRRGGGSVQAPVSTGGGELPGVQRELPRAGMPPDEPDRGMDQHGDIVVRHAYLKGGWTVTVE